MYPNVAHKWSITSQDMPLKKKLCLYSALILLVFLWFLGVRNRGDPERYKAMRLALDSYQNALKETKEEMKHSLKLFKGCDDWDPDLPVIYAITPTYARPVQKAELTRLSHTLTLVPNLHWIVVEDSDVKTLLVTRLLMGSRLNYTHLNCETPNEWKRPPGEPSWNKPRGVAQRNAALQWLHDNRNPDTDKGVVYFADDDNTYSLLLFNEMRWTKKVSVWPVGLAGGLLVEKPLLDANSQVIGFNSQWRPERPFAIDMAGFAINLRHLLTHPKAKFTFNVRGGYQESALLSHLTTREELEPLADNCTQVYVWHTRTEAVKLSSENKLRQKGKTSNEGMEV